MKERSNIDITGPL